MMDEQNEQSVLAQWFLEKIKTFPFLQKIINVKSTYSYGCCCTATFFVGFVLLAGHILGDVTVGFNSYRFTRMV